MENRQRTGRLAASCIIAFSTYSRIPMPQAAWTEENMRYTLAFFPLVGAAVGAVFWAVDALCSLLGFGCILRAALLTAVPAVVTGGIHLDGYCDTVDALASHAPKEKKLSILKDSNAGAFAVIWCCVWFLLYFALLTELESAATAGRPGCGGSPWRRLRPWRCRLCSTSSTAPSPWGSSAGSPGIWQAGSYRSASCWSWRRWC